MDSPNGETPSTKMVAIEPILGSIKYEARSHYHPVFSGDHIHSRVFVGQCQEGYLQSNHMVSTYQDGS